MHAFLQELTLYGHIKTAEQRTQWYSEEVTSPLLAVPNVTAHPSMASVPLCGTTQGDHSPDNVKFPDGSRHSSTALGLLSVTHIMPVLVLPSVVGVGMQQYMIQNHILNI